MASTKRRFPHEHLVFVYGTLKTGEPNHFLLEDSSKGKRELVGKGLTVRPYPLIIASRYNIPYLLDAPGKGKNIKGEVYSVDEAMLDALDELEDAPKYYERKVERIIIGEEDEEVECFLYALTDFKDELLDEEFIDEYSAKIKPFVPKLKREDMGRSKEYYFKDVKKPKVSST